MKISDLTELNDYKRKVFLAEIQNIENSSEREELLNSIEQNLTVSSRLDEKLLSASLDYEQQTIGLILK